MNLMNDHEAFMALVRAGLWEKEVRLSPSDIIDFNEVFQLAKEQAVIGHVAAGLEFVKDYRVPQKDLLVFAGSALQIEQRNIAMNAFIADLFEKLRQKDISTLLLKGQGIAQCYERSLWRTAGDVDLFFDEENYKNAKLLLMPISDHVDAEDTKAKHQSLIIKGFTVDLHGKMPFAESRRVDKVVDAVLLDSLSEAGSRVWQNENTKIFLPNADNDVIIVFTHFLHHFFIEGVGLRQICDWCRLLWMYRESLNHGLLESRIRKMGLMSEWKAFASLAVDTLGMPVELMPFYDVRFKDKGEKVLRRVLKSGNFGHNNDLSYRARYSGITYKIVAAWRRMRDFVSLVPVFPVDAPRFFFTYLFNKAK